MPLYHMHVQGAGVWLARQGLVVGSAQAITPVPLVTFVVGETCVLFGGKTASPGDAESGNAA